jgi:uncharacterized protein (DUF433 family)
MQYEHAQYVEQVGTGLRIRGSRVSLDSVVNGYLEGQQVETIAMDFPSLTYEQIHGAIAFYLHNRDALQEYFKAQEARWEELRLRSEVENGPLLARLRAARDARVARTA